MRVRMYSVQQIVALLVGPVLTVAAAAQTPVSPADPSPQALARAAEPDAVAGPSDQTVQIRTTRPAKSGTTSSAPRSHVSDNPGVDNLPIKVGQGSGCRTEQRRCAAGLWWASQGRQEQTVRGNGPKSKPVPVDPPSIAPTLARPPNRSAPPAELTQADVHSPAVKIDGTGGSNETRPEQSARVCHHIDHHCPGARVEGLVPSTT